MRKCITSDLNPGADLISTGVFSMEEPATLKIQCLEFVSGQTVKVVLL